MICQRPGCSNEVPAGRRKYCCEACSRIANRQRVLAAAHVLRMATDGENLDVKPRLCLVCGRHFLSDGPWNRICPRCKR